jgi:hypothetical protein
VRAYNNVDSWTDRPTDTHRHTRTRARTRSHLLPGRGLGARMRPEFDRKRLGLLVLLHPLGGGERRHGRGGDASFLLLFLLPGGIDSIWGAKGSVEGRSNDVGRCSCLPSGAPVFGKKCVGDVGRQSSQHANTTPPSSHKQASQPLWRCEQGAEREVSERERGGGRPETDSSRNPHPCPHTHIHISRPTASNLGRGRSAGPLPLRLVNPGVQAWHT